MTVLVNDVHAGACKILIKNRDQILLEEINDETSPLHYLQDIMQTIEDTEIELLTVTTDSKILKGTRRLLKRLYQRSAEVLMGMIMQRLSVTAN